MFQYLLYAYAVISLIALFLYWRDKKKAKKKRWRTPEALLLGFGFFGGAVGALLGMNLFRHKTKHWYFVFGIPAITVAETAAAVALIFYFG